MKEWQKYLLFFLALLPLAVLLAWLDYTAYCQRYPQAEWWTYFFGRR